MSDADNLVARVKAKAEDDMAYEYMRGPAPVETYINSLSNLELLELIERALRCGTK